MFLYLNQITSIHSKVKYDKSPAQQPPGEIPISLDFLNNRNDTNHVIPLWNDHIC